MSAGSWVVDDLTRHKRDCEHCRSALATVTTRPFLVDLSKLCYPGARIYRAWWEWTYDKPYPRGVP